MITKQPSLKSSPLKEEIWKNMLLEDSLIKEQLLEKLKLMQVKLRKHQHLRNPLGSQNLKENKEVASEKHTKKLTESRWLTLGHPFTTEGHAQLNPKLLNAIRRI